MSAAASAVVVPITVLQYNIAAAARDEEHEMTRWSRRAPRVAALIRKSQADIVCLQELRNFPGQPSVETWLAQFSDVYHYELAYRNPTALAFGQAVLYRKDRFFAQDANRHWFEGSLMLVVQLREHASGKVVDKSALMVGNVHFPMEEAAKLSLAKFVTTKKADDTSILCGDFNFFPDMPGCDEQRATIARVFQDLGKGAIASQDGRPLEGTFVGFDHDEMKAPMGHELVGRLDHIFGMHMELVTPPLLFTETMLAEEPKELQVRDLPSDHLPLVVTLRRVAPASQAAVAECGTVLPLTKRGMTEAEYEAMKQTPAIQ